MIKKEILKDIISFSKTLEVLYVEDEKNAQVQIVKMLENFFDKITVCDDGEEALEKFKEKKFDLIISDIYMPNMNGIELLKEVRAIDEEILFIIISGHNETNYLLDSINFAADGFLLKPIEIKQFTKMISKNIKRIKDTKEALKFKEQQSKFATLGQMMDAIAHQWKQPLASLAMSPNHLEFNIKTETEITKEEILNCIDDIKDQVEHLTSTIDDFRAFFRPNQLPRRIYIKKSIDSVQNLMKNILLKNKTEIEINGDESIYLNTIETEIKHIFINLINNSIDAYNINNINDRFIKIDISQENEKVYIKYMDNAGGIPNEIIHNIFKINFTTKEKSNGTGIGLHLVKQILEKNKGRIKVDNIDSGVCFSIKLLKN